ncbi:hypothetical protein BDN70DRAFT_854244 [Pholiota conissans]|uniref:Uncharacterized protein n=1 Tax=Pholiota conissans TaxID=109636 RepID=A0A9P5Z854_9AGAR|nr:hypothetical protein BDN70DRAFT_854244 [Pholiota conissans]
MHRARVPHQIERATQKAAENRESVSLKKGGIITEEAREMIRDLSVEGRVPDSKMNLVIQTVGRWLQMDICDKISERTVGRVVEEGGLATKAQLVQEIENEQAFTISGDGTTIRHINYESKHITVNAPSYESGASADTKKPRVRFAGITSGTNHKSETQLQGWKDLSEEYYMAYNTIFKGEKGVADPLAFATYINGNGSDHSEDQKKLNRILFEWKMLCDRLLRGKEAMRTMPLEELVRALWEASMKKIEDAGGHEAWNLLSEDEKDAHDRTAYNKLCDTLGEHAWNELPEDVRLEASLFIWAGCAMHKEMNATKGGADRMREYWMKNNLTPPVKLYNRDNAAAAALGSSMAQDRANEISQGGAIKAASLAGLLFNHKDDKKGLQDTYRNFFELYLGYAVAFPQTSSTRFQSHLEASAELLIHLPLYLSLLLEVKDNKEKGNFNHLENNVYIALQDIPTLTEMAALTLYLLAISHPYMRVVRGSGEHRVNAIDLATFHEKVKGHCQNLIDNPDLVLAPDACFTTGALDGKTWERPEALYTVHRMAPKLPHLRGCFVSFVEGALETWGRFTSEFTHGGAIDRLTVDQKKKIFISATNDHNEGALGGLRKSFWRAGSLSLRRHNAGTTYRMNGTRGYMQNVLTHVQRIRLRSATRLYQKMNPDSRRRKAQATYDAQKAQDKRQKASERREKLADAERFLDNLELELDLAALRTGRKSNNQKISVSEMKAQIDWHRRLDLERKIPIKALINKMKKDEVLVQLIIAVTRYHQTPWPLYVHGTGQVSIDTHQASAEMEWDEAEDAEDAYLSREIT